MYRYKARKRGIEWDLSFDEFIFLAKQNCYICGEQPSRPHVHDKSKKCYQEPFMSNGVDRVDPTKGYNSGNCLACCKQCNIMKWNLDLDTFIKKVLLIASRFK